MDIQFRDVPRPADADAVRSLVSGTGFFRSDETDVAVELVEETLAKGTGSGYHFWFADAGGALAGYVCYGPTPCTIGSYDLYWIVVEKDYQGRGLGRRLMAMAEKSARELGGRRMYVETSGKELYRPTRAFYLKAGYGEAARLTDFYDLGDDKLIYCKSLL